MSGILGTNDSLDQAKIAEMRQTWMKAVRDGDAEQLATLMTDDVVGVLKEGQCFTGKETVRAALQHLFALYDVERKILSSGVMIRDNWAIELDEMDSTMAALKDGMEIRAHLKMLMVYARQKNGQWKVARMMELLD